MLFLWMCTCRPKTIIGISLRDNLFELKPHIQIISNRQIITRKLNKNHDNMSLTRRVRVNSADLQIWIIMNILCTYLSMQHNYPWHGLLKPQLLFTRDRVNWYDTMCHIFSWYCSTPPQCRLLSCPPTICLSLELICEMRWDTPKHCDLLVCVNFCWQGNLFRFDSSSALLSFKMVWRWNKKV